MGEDGEGGEEEEPNAEACADALREEDLVRVSASVEKGTTGILGNTGRVE